MLIKFDADQVLVDQLKAFTGQAVGSKAFHIAARDALELSDQLRDLRRQLESARETIRVQRRSLEAARSAAVQLLEVAGQPDLLND